MPRSTSRFPIASRSASAATRYASNPSKLNRPCSMTGLLTRRGGQSWSARRAPESPTLRSSSPASDVTAAGRRGRCIRHGHGHGHGFGFGFGHGRGHGHGHGFGHGF